MLQDIVRTESRANRCAMCLFSLALLLNACGGSDADGEAGTASGPWRTERLTRGDTVIVRTLGAASPEATLSLLEEASVGRLTGDDKEMLGNVGSVYPTADGGIVLLESQAREVRQYDATGAFVRTIGGPGEGPGEYRFPGALLVSPDGYTLVVDLLGGKVNVYDPAGKMVHEVGLRRENPASTGQLEAAPDDGYLHISYSIFDPRFPDSVTTAGPPRVRAVLRMTVDGAVVDTLLAPTGTRSLATIEYRARPGIQPTRRNLPLVPYLRSDYSSQGYWVVSEDTNAYWLTLHPRDGNPVRIESDMPAVDASDAERETLRYAAQYGFRFDPTASVDVDMIPKTKPHVRELFTDADGRIWVRLHQPGTRREIDTSATGGAVAVDGVIRVEAAVAAGLAPATFSARGGGAPSMARPTEEWIEPIVYDVFQPTGEFLGRIALPENATFGNSARDKIWLVVRDELDVPRVVRYRVTGPESAAPPVAWR